MSEDSKADIASKLLDSVPTLLIVLGVAMLLLGLAAGITYKGWFPIQEPSARITAVAAGILMAVVGIVLSYRMGAYVPKAKKYGITITSPQDGDHVNHLTVRGSIKKALPKGFVLKVLRFYPNNGYVPLSTAVVSVEKGTWEAANCSTGGNPGDTRYLTAYLIGPAGNVLLDYYREASNLHNPMREQLMKLTNLPAEFLPLITEQTPDMVECHRVKVYRS